MQLWTFLWPANVIKHLCVCWDYFKQRNRVPFHVDPRSGVRAVLKWLSKILTWLWLLRLVIGLKDSRQFFNQWEAKPKPIAPWMCDFSCASSELQVIARNCDWFIVLPAPVVIGRSNCFGFGFSTVIWKPLYKEISKMLNIRLRLLGNVNLTPHFNTDVIRNTFINYITWYLQQFF